VFLCVPEMCTKYTSGFSNNIMLGIVFSYYVPAPPPQQAASSIAHCPSACPSVCPSIWFTVKRRAAAETSNLQP